MEFGFVAVFRGGNEVGIGEHFSVGYKCQSAEFLMKYKNMNCQKKYQSDGKTAMENQDDGKLVQNHTKQAGGEGDHNQCKQQPSLCPQLLSVSNGMDDTQQQKDHRYQFVDMDAGQRDHNGDKKADQKRNVQGSFHADIASPAGMVLTPQMK